MTSKNSKWKRKRGADSQRMTSQLVTILTSKKGDLIAERVQLEAMAKKASCCRTPYTDPDTKEERNLPWCKLALCPNCQTRIAKANYRVLSSQFEEYIGSGRLHEIRITSNHGNISGKRLRKVIKWIVKAFKKLTSLAAWNAVIVRVGAVIHATWKDASDTHGAGYFVHLHAVCLTSNPLPRFDAIEDEYMKILGVGPRASYDSDYYFSHGPVRNLSKTVRYISHWRKRVCGAPPVGGHIWSLWNIPDADILAYVAATKNQLRILQRGFDPDVLRVARRRVGRPRRGPKRRVEGSIARMASVYSQLSHRSPRRLTSRFIDLAEYIGERCRRGKRCRLRAACPLCLRRRLDRELSTITEGHGNGEHLVSIVLRAPGLVAADQLEAEAAAFYAAVKKLLRSCESGISVSAWKMRVGAESVDAVTMFRLSARMLVAATSTIDSTKLNSRWQRQLKSVGLKCRPEGKKAVVVIRPVTDFDTTARKLVGRVKSILGPVKEMRPDEASAYLHVLAMRSDLVISDEWAQTAEALSIEPFHPRGVDHASALA
jgi:hypothetical protein